ncbi:MAG: nucleotide exchange factor GrpE [Planctomycetota bacterium]|jgi:molecular chaperone GrpE
MTQQQDAEDKTTDAAYEDLKKKAAERDQYLDLAQRTRAEFENFQKRNRNERELERKFAFTPLVRDLLPVLDNLERALGASQQAGESGSLAQGVAMVQTQFIDLLKRNGIVRIDALNKPFDPNEHEAVMQKPSPDHEPNSVLQVLENGFMIHDRVLRPAKVIVTAKPRE